MKLLFAWVLPLLLIGCTTQNMHGKCIGLVDKEDITKEYVINYGNVAVAVILSETIIVPVVVFAYDFKCPTK